MLRVIAYIAIIYLLLLGVFYLMQRFIVYAPEQSEIDPLKLNMPMVKLIKLKTSDRYILNTWYAPAKQKDKATLVYFQGNAGGFINRVGIIAPYVAKGYGVLLLGYRGYNKNKGWPSEYGLYRDARAAINFLKSENIPTRCLVLYGESLGTGVAVQMATEFKVGALILRSSYDSLANLGQYHFKFLPVKWLLKDRYNSAEKIKNLHMPILFLHGERDYIVPINFGKKLYIRANPPKEMKIYKNASHNAMPDMSNDVISFLQRHHICKLIKQRS